MIVSDDVEQDFMWCKRTRFFKKKINMKQIIEY